MANAEKIVEEIFEENIAKLGIKRIKITLTNIKTREDIDIKVGFSWVLFLFSCAFGIPLFERKLYAYSFVYFSYWVILIALFTSIKITIFIAYIVFISTIMIMLFSLYLGFKGNEITAKNYLKLGFRFVDSYSDNVKYAKERWHIK